MAIKEIQKEFTDEQLKKFGSNAMAIAMSRELLSWYKIDLLNAEEVRTRIDEYFALMEKYDSKPLVSALATALGMGRQKLQNIARGLDTTNTVSRESKEAIAEAYGLLEDNWEFSFVNGTINPVTGIFMAKNNFGYRDQQDVVVAPRFAQEEQSQEELEKKYLESVVVD